MATKGLDANKIAELKEFVQLCKATPQILNLPQLSFFKQWLERYAAGR